MSKEKDKRPARLTLEGVSRIAKETALRDGYHVPMVLVEGSLRSLANQIIPFPENYQERMLRMVALGYEMANRGNLGELRQAFLISEGWMSTAESGQVFDGPPSENPNRKEVLIIFARVVPDLQPKIVTWEMIRDEAGKLIALRDFSSPEVAKPTSPLMDAFVAGFERGAKVARRRLN
jgi:hypothetical protein